MIQCLKMYLGHLQIPYYLSYLFNSCSFTYHFSIFIADKLVSWWNIVVHDYILPIKNTLEKTMAGT